ncbi:MAG: glycosyltransferase family 39 protein [Gemmataceae bacterium]|nr:glycosyltransferase family 39 protein [Gemmataceae bacterium]
MEGQSPGQEGEPVTSGRRRDLALVGLLLVAALALRGWLLWHTEVAARDSIGFIRYALQFEKQSWGDVLCDNHQHPGYPLTVLAVSWPARALSDAPLVDMMRVSAQLASVLAAVLLVVPMYFLGKLLFHRPGGFWSALVFQCLPVSSQILSDGLSEALFLLLTATGLLLAGLALRGRSPGRFALCGLVCGLAYLTRPEGALLLIATLLSLLVVQFVPVWRRARLELLGAATALTLAALVAGSPYYLAVGRFTNKPSVHQILRQRGVHHRPPQAPPEQTAAGPDGARPPVAAPVPAVAPRRDGSLLERLVSGLWQLGEELVKAMHYVAWAPALLGVWWQRRRLWVVPGIWVPVVLFVLHALVLWGLATAVGYLSERHVQVLILCAVYPITATLWELPPALLNWLRSRARFGAFASGRLAMGTATLVAGMVLLALAIAGLPRGLQTLHARRAGYHAAGLWLAQAAHPADIIVDRHAWALYYAGRIFVKDGCSPAPPGYRPRAYHVIGKGRERADDPVNKDYPSEERVLRLGGALVWHWPPHQSRRQATIVVYAVPPPEGKAAEGERACEGPDCRLDRSP